MKYLVALLLLPLLALAALWLFQRSLIYPAPPPRAVTIAGYAPVTLTTADGLSLASLYHPAAPGKSTLLFFHGNGDTLHGSAAAVTGPVAAGHGALLLEYRGYNGNPGFPGEAGFYQDGNAALAFLRAQGIADHDIVIIGNSIGSGAATELATHGNFGGLALVSAYTSLPAVVANSLRLPLGLLVRDRFDNLSKLPRISAAVLVLHGDRDRVIPFTQGQALGAIPGAEFHGFPGIGHELAYRPEAQAALTRWLADKPAPPATAPHTASTPTPAKG